MKYTNELFTIEYNDKNVSLDVLNKFVSIYESGLIDILKQLKISNTAVPLHLLTKNDLDNYVMKNSISYKNAQVPSWLVGFSSSKIVCLLEINDNNLNNMIKVALHESIHYILYNMYPISNRSKLLDEGLATYYSKQNYPYNLKQIKEDLKNNTLKDISDLSTQDSIKFANIKGYSYCYYVLDFLIQEFGTKKVLDWYKDISLFNDDIYKLNLNLKFTKYMLEKTSD